MQYFMQYFMQYIKLNPKDNHTGKSNKRRQKNRRMFNHGNVYLVIAVSINTTPQVG
ncbi:hypothetical protein C8R26_13119 [Nitrosomonas oligotropha]|uniref:Transposase n=1 Tax=Nitrosomonas oligotropha TaxID=42354 RepID=A0A2T5HGY7_9PROT|nr:hypothetical protein C8R26_13119 [Nitrosomonas oligotropha]